MLFFNILYCYIRRVIGLASALILLHTSAPAQTITTFAGTGSQGYSGDNGAPGSATLNSPAGVFADTNGVIYIADTGNHVIRRINATGNTITTIAGTGTPGFSGDDSTATNAKLNSPAAIFVDSTGLIYVADTGNHCVRRISATGGISTIAGIPETKGFFGDGSTATLAQLNAPAGVFVESGVIFIADTGNHRIRRINNSNIITTIAGDGTFGFFGDDSTATKAKLYSPASVFVGPNRDLYIADTGNHRIRKVSAAATLISPVAGTGKPGYSGDGDIPTNAQLAFPKATTVDSLGTMLIVDQFNQRVRRVNPRGNITTIMVNGTFGFSGDNGPSTHASIASPSFVARDPSGNIYLADSGNHLIRKIVPVDAAGLVGASRISPGSEVQILRVRLTGDGNTIVSALRVTVSDLDSPTGLSTSDIVELRLYESADSTFGPDDLLLGVLNSSQLNLGSKTTLAANAASNPGAGIERQYIATVLLDTAAIEGHGFKVGFDTGDLATSKGGRGFGVAASDSNRVLVDIIANKLRFSTQPAGSISGFPLTTQPVVVAIDSVSGFVDTDFSDTVTVNTSNTGTLINNTALATKGIATFSNLTYTTTVDDEKFNLSADDQTVGAEGDLATVVSNDLIANVVNDVPIVDLPNLQMTEDDPVGVIFQIASIVTDPDDAELTFTFLSDNILATVKAGQIQIRPALDYFGTDTLTLIATDSFGAQGMDTGIIEVFPVNDAPVVNMADSITVAEDDTLSFNLQDVATDVDDNFDQLEVTIIPSSGLQTHYDSTSAIFLAWAPADSSGVFFLDLYVRDLFGVSTRDTVQIVVQSVNDSPVFAVADTSLLQTDTLSLNLRSYTSDIDSFDALKWQAAPHANLNISIDADGTALLIPTAGSVGMQSVVFTVVDQELSVSDTTTVQVIKVNQSPVLQALPDTVVSVGDTVRIDLTSFVTDPDSAFDSLSWQVSGGMFVGSMVLGGQLDLWARTDSSVTELLQLVASDPTNLADTTTAQVTLFVPPAIIGGIPDFEIEAGKILEIPLAPYLRSDVATIDVASAPTFHVEINTNTRIATVNAVDNFKGTAAIIFTGGTGDGQSTTDTTLVTVLNPAPVISSFPDLFLDSGASVQLSLDAFVRDDEDLGNLTWSALTDVGVQVTILGQLRTAVINAKPEFVGDANVVLTVADAQNASATDTLLVTVRAAQDSSPPDTTGSQPDSMIIKNRAPTIHKIPPLTLQPGVITELILDQFVADDGPFANLSWFSLVSPKGMVQVKINGARIASITAEQDWGAVTITFRVEDAQGAAAVAEVRASIEPPLVGDFSGDSGIDFDDFFLLADALGLTLVHPDWNPIFDLDKDGRISFEDFFIFADLFQAAQGG